MPENPHRPEHKVGPLMFGNEWISSCIDWYKEIGLDVRSMPYVFNEEGILTNPDGTPIRRNVMRERKVISEYLSSQPKDYQDAVQNLASSFPPMSPDCRIGLQLPTHNEERHIYNTLRGWASQLTHDGNSLPPSQYEIMIVNNGPEGYPKDNTMSEINRFKKDFPHIKLNHIDIEFPTTTGNVGLARKVITDTLLQRSINRPFQIAPFYIESEDGDILEIDKHTLSSRIQELDNKPYLDAISGIQDFNPNILMENDYLFFSIRARKMSKALLTERRLRPDRNEYFSFHNRVTTGGWNNAFTAESYALIGGYLAAKVGEDYDIGKRISVMRGQEVNGKFVPNTYTVESSNIRMQSSPRRFIHAALNNIRPYMDFADKQITTELRELDLEEMMEMLPNARISAENVQLFESVLSRQIRFFARTVKHPDEQARFFKRLIYFLGFGKHTIIKNDDGSSSTINSRETDADCSDWDFDCEVDAKGKVTIKNIGNIKHALDSYRERHKKR